MSVLVLPRAWRAWNCGREGNGLPDAPPADARPDRARIDYASPRGVR
jgi:hypothetical protein